MSEQPLISGRGTCWKDKRSIKSVLVGKDGKADAATKLECDYIAQILLPSIKAQD